MSVKTFKCRGCRRMCVNTMQVFTGDDINPVLCPLEANMIQTELCLWVEDTGEVKKDVRMTGAATDAFEKAWSRQLRKNFFGEGGKSEV